MPLPVYVNPAVDSSCACFSDLAFRLLVRLRQRRLPTSARAITPHGTATPAAMATVLELLADATEVARTGVEVAVAAVVEAVAAGEGDPVAFAVEAARFFHISPGFSAICDLHIPAVVVGRPAETPRAQYASNTEMALEACADQIGELHESEMAHVIRVLNSELESVQKQV
ncbi:hypothetical protein VSDG_00632 [Cytospora chrysosperma]|uniref:Uncharacterized protein n=1 Tax=Cytospora chrysosperma TaxID=252740 RepID=A0A423WNI0_CYTCH|nr:hypothetical protein VSDG_00632 [Valsa sordida]